MREIKFRAWNTRDNFMDIEPYQFEFDHDNNCRAYEDWRALEDGRSYPCELMQYTGLKDKNGKEIYELHEINNKYRVIYKFNRYVLQDISNSDIFVEISENDKYEITREYCPLA